MNDSTESLKRRELAIIGRYNESVARKNQLEGSLALLMKQLKEKYSITSVEALDAEIEKLEAQKEGLMEKLMPMMESLEKVLGL